MESRDRVAEEVVVQSRVTPWRIRLGAWSLFLAALAFVQAPGRIVGDTKLDLVVAPGSFLQRALGLWDPNGAFGQVQNQAYGYLFPMGPFFWLGSVIDLPGWVVQRLWWSLILVVAFLGMVKLLSLLGVGAPWARVVASLAFALSPRFLSVLGPSSIEVWPSALAPWVLIPLIVAVRRGDPRRGAALSAIAVACVGGVNAVATFAVIPMAVWWLVVAPPGPRRRSLRLWWPPLVLLATAWWLLPLLLLGRYSPPFLDYIESVSNTAFPSTTVDALRGTSNWVPYVDPGSEAGRLLISESLLILDGAVLVAFGLYGLARADLPWRRFVVPSMLVGLMLVTLGHAGATPGLGSETLRTLLDGPLAPLRNAHKFDVLIRLPLIIGLCHALSVLTRRRTASAFGAMTLAIVAVVGSTSPAWTGRLAPQGSFTAIPGYWQEASSWLEKNSNGRAVLTPSSTFGRYVWGRTNDEPLQPLLDSPWAVRNVIPLAPGSNIDMLDTLTAELGTGRGSSQLAGLLRRAGAGTIVLRHDLDRGGLEIDSPETVRATLLSTPGMQRVASFGPMVGGGSSLMGEDGQTVFVDQGRQAQRHAIEVFSLADPVFSTALHENDTVPTVVGDAGSLLKLDELDAIPEGPSIFGPDASRPPRGPVTLTDGNRRQEASFAQVTRNRSASLTPQEPFRADRGVHRYDEETIDGWSSVPHLRGARSLTASSSRSDVGARPVIDQSASPWAAFDGDPRTSWRPNEIQGREAWLDLDLGRTRNVGEATITLDLPRDQTRELRVSTEDGVESVTAQGGRTSTIAVGSVRHLRIEALRTPQADVAISEITLEQVTLTRPLQLPTLPESWPTPDQVLLQAESGRNDGCLMLAGIRRCSDAFVRPVEDGRTLDREVPLAGSASFATTARVTADAGPDLDALLQRGRLSTVGVSSQQSTSVLGGALALVDGTTRAGWTAAADDIDPTVTLRWVDSRRISQISMPTSSTLAASPPRSVRLVFGNGDEVEAPVVDGRVRFDPVRTESVEIHLLAGARRSSVDFSGAVSALPVGLTEVSVPGLDGFADLTADQPVRLSCSEGPSLTIDGRTFPGRLNTTVAALVSGEPLAIDWCDDPDVRLEEGMHRVRADSGIGTRPLDVVLQRTTTAPTPAQSGTVLATTMNTNTGWEASDSNGELLEPVVLDGWRQGWLASDRESAGEASMSFEPGSTYQAGLLVGGLYLLVVILVATLPARERFGGIEAAEEKPQGRSWAFAACGVVAAAVTAGWVAVLAVMLAVVSLQVARRRIPAAPAIAAAAMGGGAVLLYAFAPWGSFDTWAGDRVAPQLLAWIGVGSVLVAAGPLGLRLRNGRSTRR